MGKGLAVEWPKWKFKMEHEHGVLEHVYLRVTCTQINRSAVYTWPM